MQHDNRRKNYQNMSQVNGKKVYLCSAGCTNQFNKNLQISIYELSEVITIFKRDIYIFRESIVLIN